MPGGYLYGFYKEVGEDAVPVKISCDSEGRLIIDPALILEDDPTENESTKAPTSKWAFAHKATPGAHHDKFTAAEARAAIDDIFGSDGKADKTIDLDQNIIQQINLFRQRDYGGDVNQITLAFTYSTGIYAFYCHVGGSTYKPIKLATHNGAAFENLATEVYVDSKVAIVKGTHYWSCPGISFDALNPNTDQVYKSITGYINAEADNIYFTVGVNLLDGAIITGVIIYGNDGAAAETWYMERLTNSNGVSVGMANARVNVEDTTIDNPVIDSSLYSYYLRTTSLDLNDRLYGARVTYTL